MGNILRKRKKVVTEELESLSQQMKTFREDIEKTAEARRMILWYFTLSAFFISSSFIGYAWLHFQSREQQCLDDLIEKKRSILETVKETETFKVAKEILEKYGDEPKKSVSQPSSPDIQKRLGLPKGGPGNAIETPCGPGASSVLGGPPIMGRGSLGPTPARSLRNISQAMPLTTPIGKPRLINKPIRPFQRESTSAVDKVVDYFFGDGPNNRLALICGQCHGHNGMAMPAEFDYLAFVCFICGYFNPAKKLRPNQIHNFTVPSTTPSTVPTAAELNKNISVQDFEGLLGSAYDRGFSENNEELNDEKEMEKLLDDSSIDEDSEALVIDGGMNQGKK
uniref:Endoplasmic reticulum junction formation protein lunapark n=1 Tax=Heterorhabditis bacteriophora TaxID=37862 RepID=A0A1I7XMB4_HETBA